MKVLLLGDYSAIHLNLAEGLRENGIDVTLLSDGDGWKKIPGQRLSFKGRNPWTRTCRRLYGIARNWSSLKGNDVIQFVSPTLCNPHLLRFLGGQNRKRFILGAGSDSVSVLEFLKLDYSPLQAEVKAGELGMLRKLSAKSLQINRRLACWADGVITTSPTYHKAYAFCPGRIGPIPMPISLGEGEFRDNQANGRIRIFHGVSRKAFKGSDLIVEAMKQVRDRYPDKVELEIVEQLPLADYLERVQKSNLVIDQAYSKGYGMNALYAMARGKVVLSGQCPELVPLFGMDSCPVIDIPPDASGIAEILGNLVERISGDGEALSRMGRETREFVEKYHSSRKVAARYLDAWGNT